MQGTDVAAKEAALEARDRLSIASDSDRRRRTDDLFAMNGILLGLIVFLLSLIAWYMRGQRDAAQIEAVSMVDIANTQRHAVVIGSVQTTVPGVSPARMIIVPLHADETDEEWRARLERAILAMK